MITGVLRSLLDEPAVPDPPRRVWRDWFVAAAIVVGSIIEMLTRDLPWEIPTMIASVVLAATVFWRRTHRVPSMLVAFGSIWVLSLLVWLVADGVVGYYSMAWVLVVPYAVFRWGSGRECALAVPVLLVAWVIGITTDPGSIGDDLGGLTVLAAAPAAGLEVRQLRSRRQRVIDQARHGERELLARELHDTVAHHVSAIAIQAQAGRAVADTKPEAAIDALAVIEDEASRTLVEMRTMVAALRDEGDQAELAPQRGVTDIRRLGTTVGGPVVDVQLTGDLDGLAPSLDAALYRIAQESITNATRHAVGATRIDVHVIGEPDNVRLVVSDDGRSTAAIADVDVGFGLIGMAERAKLLGGSVTAGRTAPRGWIVDAALPRERSRS